MIDTAATPDLVPAGAMVLQPSEERRRSGSHYTPRSLTEPIVRTTLEPVLDGLRGEDGRPPRPEQILELKVCDPAMGSGAFLVEACRQLGDALVEAWNAHGDRPEIPSRRGRGDVCAAARRAALPVRRRPQPGRGRPREDVAVARDARARASAHVRRPRAPPRRFARRPVASPDRGVPLEVHGVAASRRSVSASTSSEVAELRRQIREAGDDTSDCELRDLWDEAQSELGAGAALRRPCRRGLLLGGEEPRARDEAVGVRARSDGRERRDAIAGWLEELREAEPPLVPFHWEIEFPEVFERDAAGFDAIVGNPPFAGKNTIAQREPRALPRLAEGAARGKPRQRRPGRALLPTLRSTCCDRDGTFGLIATNTIGQGDTRSTGLRWICTHGGEIYTARKRFKWPGRAAVVVSVVHVVKGAWTVHSVCSTAIRSTTITAYLFHAGGHEDPAQLAANAGKSFQGSIVLGMGFTFDDTDTKGVATSLAEMRRLIENDPRNAEVIFPYIGGEEVNDSPTHAHHRYVINFGELDEDECRERWPELMAIVEEKVKPERMADRTTLGAKRVLVAVHARDARRACTRPSPDLDRVLVACRATSHTWRSPSCQPRWYSPRHSSSFALDTYAAFCAPPVAAARSLGALLRLVAEGRSPLHAVGLLRDLPVSRRTGTSTPSPRGCRRGVLRAPRGADGQKRRRPDEDVQPLPRPVRARSRNRAAARAARGDGSCGAATRTAGMTSRPTCEFLLDYEIDEEEWGNKQKPYRYRWPDDVRDEVLARLIALNGERAAAEQRSGAAAAKRAR